MKVAVRKNPFCLWNEQFVRSLEPEQGWFSKNIVPDASPSQTNSHVPISYVSVDATEKPWTYNNLTSVLWIAYKFYFIEDMQVAVRTNPFSLWNEQFVRSPQQEQGWFRKNIILAASPWQTNIHVQISYISVDATEKPQAYSNLTSDALDSLELSLYWGYAGGSEDQPI